jgi:uncharacterized phage protein (TIGR02218 family)
MRAIPPALQAKLDTGCTTLATCWIVRRGDGAALGFTDHDEDVLVDGITCRAASGFDGAAAAEKLGFAVGAGEVAGALVDNAIAEADIRAGRYDGARVEIHVADWSEPSLSVLLRVMRLGEITREGVAFRAELRALTDALDEERGRLYTPRCSADLGDHRCALNIAALGLTASVTVAAVGPDSVTCAGLGAFAPDLLVGGRLVVTSGGSQGFAVEIAAQTSVAGGTRLTLWQPPPEPIAPGDGVTVSAGCDKQYTTCRDRFANALNFRGFPHMPGIDRIVSVPVPGEGGHDGSSLNG